MRNRYVILADIVAICSAGFGAFVLYFGWQFIHSRAESAVFLAAVVVIKPIVFYWFGLYRRYWRYATVLDLVLVVFACGAAAVAVALFIGFSIGLGLVQEFSRAVLVIDSLLTLLAVGGVRMSIRVAHEPRVKTGRARWLFGREELGGSKRVLVVGAGDAGTMVVREIQRNPQLGKQVVGFLDDDQGKLGTQIYEVPVLGGTQSLGAVVTNNSIEEVVIAMPTAPGAFVRKVLDTSRKLGVPAQTVPGVFELLDGKASVSRLRSVEITDLLRRRQVTGDLMNSGYVTGQTVLITGAGGSIGSELCRQVAFARPALLVLLGHGENSLFTTQANLTEFYPDVSLCVIVADIRNRDRIEQIFQRFRPDVVFHAAAHKHVHLMEDNFQEAISNNVAGTGIVVEAARRVGTQRFVGISTDKAVSPSSFMGASKRLASHIVREGAASSGKAYTVVRFGNVLGSRGSVVPFFKQQIDRGGPVTITHPEMKRYFMTIAEAVHLVMEAGGMSKGGELFVLNMGEPIRIVDLVEDLVRLSGLETDQIPIVVTGIRPGEKLEEALWEDDATVQVTANPDILRVKEPGVGLEEFQDNKTALLGAARDGDRFRVESILSDLIPTFTPSPRALLSGNAPAGANTERICRQERE